MEFPHGFIARLWEKAGSSVKRSGSSLVSAWCPSCGYAKTGHRVSLDPERNLWKCHGEGCGAGGGVKTFCELVGWDFSEMLYEAGLWMPVQHKGKDMRHDSWHDKTTEMRKSGDGRRNITGHIDLSSILCASVTEEVRQYLTKRGIDPQLVEGKYVFGIDPACDEYSRWLWTHGYRFFVAQYSRDGEILSGRFRLIETNSDQPKSRSPKGRSNFLFSEYPSKGGNATAGLIVEGEIDFLSALTITAVMDDIEVFAVPGARYTLRDDEIERLPDEVYLFLDRDAEDDTLRLARQLYARRKRVYIGRYLYKDLNEHLMANGEYVTRQQLIEAMRAACAAGPYSPLQGILSYANDFVCELEKNVEMLETEGKQRVLRVFPTGIDKIDEILAGGFRSGVYGIAGAPGAGKTSFLLSLLKSLIRTNDVYVLFASLEMTIQQIISYLLSWETHMNWVDVFSANINRAELERLKEAIKESQWLFRNLHVLNGGFSARDVERELVELKNMLVDENRSFLVALDYLQMLRTRGNYSDVRLAISDAIRELAEIANRHNVPIIITSSVARGVVDDVLRGKRSVKEVFKESGDIEYALFAGFLLVKDSEEAGGIRCNRLIISKNRAGPELEGHKGKPIEVGFEFNVFTGEIS